MARRRTLMPALRDYITETKTLTLSGGFGYRGGGYTARSSTYGMVDRSAGWDIDLVVEGYERCVWVFKSVEIIAGNASRLPFTIGNADEQVLDDPLLRVMNKKANPLESARAFRKRLSAQILLSKKGAFVEVTKSRAGRIVRLDLLDPSRVEVIRDPRGDYVQQFDFTRPDGVVRHISPDRIRWIKEDHPFDPFSAVTPLEAAGMSVELDQLARLYNVSFIKRDGRPGGILGIDASEEGGIDEAELERIAKRMKAGPSFAGEIAAVGTGRGGIQYIDTSARPREMAYENTAQKSQAEILAAFSVPMSLAGDASDRTYDNAEQEEFNFWQYPMLPHLALIAAAFDDDIDPDMDCGFDTSGVEALELPDRRRREEARQEWNAGLITIKEYRKAAKKALIDNAHTRALWISPTKAPVPSDPADKAELGLGDDGSGGGGGMPPGGPEAPAAPGDGGAATAAEVVAQEVATGGHGEATDAASPAAGDAASVVDAARQDATTTDTPAAAQSVVDAARLEVKSLELVDASDPEPDGFYEPTEDELTRTELAVAAALDALLARQANIIAARLESPKSRKGTSYWIAADEQDPNTGDEPIDAAKAVDAARWAGEMQATLGPIATPAAQGSANGLLTALATAGALTVPPAVGAVVLGRAVEGAAPSAEQLAAAAAQAGIAPAMLALTIAEQAMRDWLDERVIQIDALMVEQSPSLDELLAGVRQMWADHSRALVDSLSLTIAQTAVLGGRDAAAAAVTPQVQAPPAGAGLTLVETPSEVDRIWRCREDERVRKSHVDAAGQLRPVGEPFEVGGYDVRYPCDPLAPPSVTRNCRCWLRYVWAYDAKFTLPEQAA